MRLFFLAPFVLLAACAGQPKTVIREVPIEVKVPVRMPCMGERPEQPVSLRDKFTEDEWRALTTDQRANLVAAQAIARMIYGNQLADASAGCR